MTWKYAIESGKDYRFKKGKVTPWVVEYKFNGDWKSTGASTTDKGIKKWRAFLK